MDQYSEALDAFKPGPEEQARIELEVINKQSLEIKPSIVAFLSQPYEPKSLSSVKAYHR